MDNTRDSVNPATRKPTTAQIAERVRCPVCRQHVGRSCVSLRDRWRGPMAPSCRTHPERVAAGRAALTPETP
jgi:hypothetical protein